MFTECESQTPDTGPGIVAHVRDDEVAIATVRSHATGELQMQQKFHAQEFPTFTDVLIDYSRRTGIPLRGLSCAVVLSGAVSAGSLALVRTKWTVSPAGLESMFDRPVTLINVVGAFAWSLLAPNPPLVQPLTSMPDADLRGTGRWAVILLDRGIGLAALNREADGSVQVLECEAGHTGFAPSDSREDQLLQALRRRGGRVTWENVLTLPADDPVWTDAGLNIPREERQIMRAAMMGTFVGDVIIGIGAWRGALLTGSLSLELKQTGALEAFRARVHDKKPFHRLLSSCQQWLLTGDDLSLKGGATMLSHRASKHSEAARPG